VVGASLVLSWLRAKVPKKASDPFSYAIFGTFTLSRDNTRLLNLWQRQVDVHLLASYETPKTLAAEASFR